jgi:phosphonate transport system substrate-binding protein
MIRRHALAACAILAVTSSLWFSGAQAQTREVNFGFISTESSANLKSAWQPLLDDLQKSTGLKVNAFFVTDYAGVIEAMRFNKVQVAWMGNKSAMEAVDRSNGEIFGKIVAKDGSEGYYGVIIVNKDSPLKTLDDVMKNHASLTLGFGDPNSTSGTAVPSFYAFGPAHVDPLKDFRRTVRASHETNLLAVVNKQVDVATNNTENLERFEQTHPEQAKQVREIWRSPLIASDPLVWRKDLDDRTKKLIRDFMLSYGKDAREKAILANIEYSGFRASSDAQLIPIRQIELARARAAVEADTTLGAVDKAKKLADIDARLADLGRQIASAK